MVFGERLLIVREEVIMNEIMNHSEFDGGGLPSSVNLSDGEKVLSIHTFRYSIVYFWLKTILVRTNRRIHSVQPTGVIIALGKKIDDMPIEQISATRVEVSLNIVNTLAGVIAAVVGFVFMVDSPGLLPLVILVSAAVLLIESTETFIQIGSTGTASLKIKVSRLDKADAEEAISTIATSLHKTDSGDSPMSAKNVVKSDSPSNLDELEKLASLRDKGILTEDEFNAKKKELLGL